MELRLARSDDLPALKEMYSGIVREMEAKGIFIWDEVYPGTLFQEDIDRRELYLLVEGEEIAAAFALFASDANAARLRWRESDAQALYLGRLGVRASGQGRGTGALALRKAAEAARRSGAAYLRLFVVDKNEPAISFYLKNGFVRAEGVCEDDIGNGVLLEYGFELCLR